MTTATAMSDRVHQIYEDCGGVHATDGLHDGCIFGTGLHLNQNTVDVYIPELRDLLERISPEIHTGCSWRECMRDSNGNVWADSATVTELIMLAYKARLVDPLLPREAQARHLSIMNQPWYHTTGL